MQDHAESQNPETQGKFSRLDWPTPEFLMAAHRARGRVLREMIFALCHRLRLLVAKGLPKAKISLGANR